MFPLFLKVITIGNQESTELEAGEETEPFNMVMAHLENSLRDLRALGPFRTPPARKYEFAGKDFEEIGLDGKHAVDVLIAEALHKKSRILKNISGWLSESGLAGEISLHEIGTDSSTYSVVFNTGATPANFADVGFGLSQVLPVLVQGWKTPKKSLFVCQQPELHLHPDAQVQLASFFASLVKEKRQVIVETHSEPLVLGIRRVLAEAIGKQKPLLTREQVSFLYVDDSAKSGARVRSLDLDEDMNIANWPRGFMEETTSERLKIIEHTLLKETAV